MISVKSFFEAVELIVDNFEGGYYHPEMFKDGRIKDPNGKLWEIYKTSGETMYGLDRLQGGDLNKSEAGKIFWRVIDTQGAKYNWTWNFPFSGKDKVKLLGGVSLKDLTHGLKFQLSQIMRPTFNKFFNKYLTKNEQDIIEKSKPLQLHFIYAVWNGEGFFKFYSENFKKDIDKGITDVNQLFNNQIKLRKSSRYIQIRQSGEKMERMAFNLIAPDIIPQKKSSYLMYAIVLIAVYLFAIK